MLRRQGRQFDFVSTGFIGRLVGQRQVRPAAVLEIDPACDFRVCLAAGLEGVEEHAFVFERTPQPLDEDIVHPAAAPSK